MTTKEKATTKAAARPQTTKREQLMALLQCNSGASLDEMVAVLGWLPHTTRAALSGLRKAGMTVESGKIEGVRRYRIVEAAA